MDFEVYKKLGFNKLTEDSFNDVITDSEMLIQMVTHYYYEYHDIDIDLNSNDLFIKNRANVYQKAICMQCDFANELGYSSLLGQRQSAVSDVSIGRTHIQRSTGLLNGVVAGKSGVYLPVYEMLAGTGLLYGGVNSH